MNIRIWDTKKKKWLDHTTAMNHAVFGQMPGDNTLRIEWADWHIVQRSTGLTDRLGKEIFEGDIVIGRNYKNEAGNPREVKWSNSGYEAGGLPLWALNKSEVIGNIYEHPHLLEDK